MKIAAALGVWPFWGWKIINHGGWFTQVKGRTWQKKRSSLYRSCLHERVILPDYRITLLLQLIRHFYVSSILCAICTSDPLPERAENGFSGCAGNASRPRNKLRSRSPFSGGKNAGNRTYPGWVAWISALCTCAHTHACCKNRACAFLAGFRCTCHHLLPVNHQKRPEAVFAVRVRRDYGK